MLVFFFFFVFSWLCSGFGKTQKKGVKVGTFGRNCCTKAPYFSAERLQKKKEVRHKRATYLC